MNSPCVYDGCAMCGTGDAEIGKYLLDDRARVERELGLQHGTPSLEPPDLFDHQLEVDQSARIFRLAVSVARDRM